MDKFLNDKIYDIKLFKTKLGVNWQIYSNNLRYKMKKGLIIFLSEIKPKMFKIFNSNKSNGEESPKKHEDKLLTSNKPDSATYFLSEKSGNQTAGHG